MESKKTWANNIDWYSIKKEWKNEKLNYSIN